MLRRSDGLARLQEGGVGQEWILARRFCAFTVLDAGAIPFAKRKAYADMAVQRWSPFADTRHYIDWVGARAMVWAWSHGQILDIGDGELVPPPRRVSPETLYRGAPHADEASLVAMDEGVEGRVWRDHALIACQWWPAAPALEEWNSFRRGAGLAASQAMPVVESPPMLRLPWTRQRVIGFTDLAGRHRKVLQRIAAGFVVALLAMPLAASIRLAVKTALLERVIDREAVSVGDTLAAREAAERHVAAIDQLLKLRPPRRQLQLMSAAIAATPGGNWKLLEWRMPDSSSLEVVLQMTSPDPIALVRGWEATEVFRNVAVDLGRSGNEVTIKADIASATAPQQTAQ